MYVFDANVFCVIFTKNKIIPAEANVGESVLYSDLEAETIPAATFVPNVYQVQSDRDGTVRGLVK